MKIDVNKMEGLREAKGWTKTNLSIQSGVSAFTLNSIRKGKDIREATAQAIADALGVPLGDILLEEEEQTVQKPVEAAQEPASDAITQTLEAVRKYGEAQYEKGKDDMCRIFLQAVKEAIDRWNEMEEGEA